jgi:hypothetical protein
MFFLYYYFVDFVRAMILLLHFVQYLSQIVHPHLAYLIVRNRTAYGIAADNSWEYNSVEQR